jgi:hypothetical protein
VIDSQLEASRSGREGVVGGDLEVNHGQPGELLGLLSGMRASAGH